MIKVLFVCMGNICRSPTAEGVFRKTLQKSGLADQVEIDSAGMDGYHTGESPDRRAQRAAERRGYDLSGIRARRITPGDFDHFDLILGMDRKILKLLREACPQERSDRLGLYLDFAKRFHACDVPDPYYGQGDGFEQVLDMVEDTTAGLCDAIKAQLLASPSNVNDCKTGRISAPSCIHRQRS